MRNFGCSSAVKSIHFGLISLAPLATLCCGPSSKANAQIVMDGSLGTAGSLTGPHFDIPANLGKQFGPNLFHSFRDFQLHQGESANFSGPTSIKNILSRVTGGRTSVIDGQLNSSIAGANFFFINPAGIVFGPKAQLNVGGDFTATTASLVYLDGKGQFSAEKSQESVLSSAAPSAFGFLKATPTSIRVNGGTLNVATRQNISLVGGDISLSGGGVFSDQGITNLVSARSSGDINGVGSASRPFDVRGLGRLGNIEMNDGAKLFGFENGGVNISAGNLSLSGRATSITQENERSSRSGTLSISLNGTLRLADGAFLQSRAFGNHEGAPVVVRAHNILLLSGGQILSLSEKAGKGGRLDLEASTIDLFGGSNIGSTNLASGAGGSIHLRADHLLTKGENTAISTLTQEKHGGGNSGKIVLDVYQLEVRDSGSISTATLGNGSSGNIEVRADAIVLDGENNPRFTGFSTGNGSAQVPGSGGDITIRSNSLDIRNGGLIATDTSGTGVGGDIDIRSNSTRIDGKADASTGISAVTFATKDGGRAGSIRIQGKEVLVRRGGIVTTTTFGSGHGGSIEIAANDIILDGGGSANDTSITAETSDKATGRGGGIQLNARSLQVLRGAEVSTSSYGVGSGGDINVKADNFQIDGMGSEKFTGLNATTFREQGKAGQGGNINVHGKRLLIVDGGAISGATLGLGNAGNITVNAERVEIDRRASGLFTGISGVTNAHPHVGEAGSGGSVVVKGRKLQILNGGEITTDTLGNGIGGSITIASDTILIDGQRSVADEAVSTGLSAGSALKEGGGAGGNINITANSLDIRNTGTVSTASEGTGPGGDITVEARNISLDGGGVSAASRGRGNAGKIDLHAAENVTLSRGSFIETAAPNANGQNIVIYVGRDLVLTGDSGIASFAGGDGGGIQLSAARRIHLRNSQLQAQAGGTGGNIDIDAPTVILDRSRFEADAVAGNGGNITIRARAFLASAESRITASSQLGLAGIIAIQSPNTNVGGSLILLPSNLLEAERFLNERCAVRSTGATSSFTVNPQNGVPSQPGDFLPSILPQ